MKYEIRPFVMLNDIEGIYEFADENPSPVPFSVDTIRIGYLCLHIGDLCIILNAIFDIGKRIFAAFSLRQGGCLGYALSYRTCATVTSTATIGK